ncbi:beta-1,6-N-acetylglucosaminyltransferase [Myroides sp. WP-1]|uniref:beta-1,6-N-acetylglucosaminyltransferase n=1 Tax=Myroides sp. WP-1 TaxID=2759944 RepID=UPI0015FBE574|nr:beta-1,6-N-acetylglucosaminyltransferase [Myroides sp. WP-1]MBB1140833.1 glycosyl transferase family 14 [Myroides sp. WP-1]
MNIFYLVQAHTNPQQLKRLIDRLLAPNVHFIIHIDLKSDLAPFESICVNPQVCFIENRVNCIWGDFSQVQATLNLIDALGQYNPSASDRVTLISGQDYPLQTTNDIQSFYQQNQTIDFIEKFVAKEVHPRAYLNFRGFKVNKSDRRGDYVIFKKHKISGLYKSILKGCFKFSYLKYLFIQKELDSSIVFYKGSSWWALRYDTLMLLVGFYSANKVEWHHFFKTTFCADEYFFQTLLVEVMKTHPNIQVKDILTFIDWDRKGVPLPVTFSIADQEQLKQAAHKGYLYARKFNAQQDEEILSWLDLENSKKESEY